MSEVKRFDAFTSFDDFKSRMVESKDGNYVAYSDYLSQRQQTDALQTYLNNIINAFGIKGEGAHSKLVIEYVHGLVAESEAMDKFVDECLQVAWEGGSLDGGEIQDIGLKHGLLREEVYSSDQHESLVEDPSNFEDGDAVYFRTDNHNTDAFTAELRAQGVDEFAESVAEMHSKTETGSRLEAQLAFTGDAAVSFAANLRAGRKG